jgi:hypothetical protein
MCASQVGIFQTLFMNVSPADAYSRLAAGAPYDTFRDASTGESMLPLTILHVIEVRHPACWRSQRVSGGALFEVAWCGGLMCGVSL